MSEGKSFRIAVLPGDGVGPEVVGEAVKVLRAVEARGEGLQFTFTELAVGAAEFLRGGDPLPASSFEAAKEHDAILLGAMGLPDVRWPGGLEMTPQIDLREMLDLYCGLRPIRLYHADHGPLKGFGPGDIDFLIVRENTEGLFTSRGQKVEENASQVVDSLKITRPGAERICRAAFQEAGKRRKQVTLIDKANVLPSMVFFRRVFDGVAADYPDIRTDRIYVDAASLYFVQRPGSFDVVVTENMFGDILSDLAAGLIGGMGMAPSADLGDTYGVFQPSHGSAPDIAGKGIANPVATILSAAMMLDWLGGDAAARGSRLIRSAVEEVLLKPENRTKDLGGRTSTVEMGDRISEAVTRLDPGASR